MYYYYYCYIISIIVFASFCCLCLDWDDNIIFLLFRLCFSFTKEKGFQLEMIITTLLIIHGKNMISTYSNYLKDLLNQSTWTRAFLTFDITFEILGAKLERFDRPAELLLFGVESKFIAPCFPAVELR